MSNSIRVRQLELIDNQDRTVAALTAGNQIVELTFYRPESATDPYAATVAIGLQEGEFAGLTASTVAAGGVALGLRLGAYRAGQLGIEIVKFGTRGEKETILWMGRESSGKTSLRINGKEAAIVQGKQMMARKSSPEERKLIAAPKKTYRKKR